MCGLGALAPALAEQQDAAVDPPEAQADDARDQEARGREQHPVFAHPEDQAGVFPVPAAAPVPPEERPWLFVVLVRHQHPYSPCLAAIPAACTCSDNDCGPADGRGGAAAFVLLPDDAEEEGTGAVHDCYVGKFPIAVVGYKGFNHEGEEGVVGDGAHGVVGDAGGIGAADPGWVGEERVQATVTPLEGERLSASANREFLGRGRGNGTYIVEVDIYPTIVREDKVSNGVCSLYRLGVVVEGF